jgi:hypothetical protein
VNRENAVLAFRSFVGLVFGMVLTTAAAWAQVPSVGSVTPPNGSGIATAAQTLTFTDSFPGGVNTIGNVDIVLNNVDSGANGCFLVFFQSIGTAGAVYLFSDSGAPWAEVRLGTSDVQSNSHCQINGSASSYSFNSGTLTLNVNVEFLSPWIGATLEFYEQAVDTSGNTSNWWQIPGATFFVTRPNNHPPSLGSGPTSSGAAGVPQTIAFTASDPDGYTDLADMNFVINNVGSGTNACFGVWFAYLNAVYVFDNTPSVWYPVQLRTAGSSYSNSQCTVTGLGSSFTGSGNTGTLALNVTFTQAFAGTRYFWQLVEDESDATAGWGQIPGSFTVTTGLAAQTITFAAPGNFASVMAPFPISASASSGLVVSFASTTTGVCTISGATVTIVAMGTCSITASQAGNASYSAAAPVTQSFTVQRAMSSADFRGAPLLPVPLPPPSCVNSATFTVFNDGITRSNCYFTNYTAFFTNSCTATNPNVIVGVGLTSFQILHLNFTANTNAVPGTFTVSCTATGVPYPIPICATFDASTCSLTFNMYDASPTITSVQLLDYYTVTPISAIPAGGQAYAAVYGSNFGPSQGSVAVCQDSVVPCVSSDVSAAITYWAGGPSNPVNQVNLLLTSSATSSGTYDIVLTSLGASGTGFLQQPQGPGPQTNPGKAPVGPCATPSNFQQVSASDVGNGILVVTYGWTSSSLDVAVTGLSCQIQEYVQYPGTSEFYTAASPPFPADAIFQNPTPVLGAASAGYFIDRHIISTAQASGNVRPLFVQPLRTDSFTATQSYRWRCTCNGNNMNDFSGFTGMQIIRKVLQNPDGTFYYNITKSGGAPPGGSATYQIP